MDKLNRTDAEWRAKLTPEQYRILRQAGTEPPFSGDLLDVRDPGDFRCAACGEPLFTSGTKFESGTGWPSFFQPIEGAVETTSDTSYGMARIEVHCARCGGHLGHLFPDGPRPTGQRYCMNGLSLKFEPSDAGQV